MDKRTYKGVTELTKIFHIITTINRGGAENQLLILAKEQIKQGFEVHVVYLKGEPELEKDLSRYGVYVHSDLSGVNPIFQPFFLKRLLPRDSHILHAHLPRAEIITCLLPRKISLVITRHNTEPFYPGAPGIISRILSKLVTLRSKYVIAISNSVKDYIISHKEIFDYSKIRVIHYGYVNKFNRSEKLMRQRTEISRIGTIARLTEQKDFPTLIKVFQQFLELNPKSTLSVIGAGPLEHELNSEVRSLNLQNVISFLGRRSEVYEFLQSLDVFILTSKYEGFGMVLLEAMDAQVPVIASRNSAIPEVLGEDFPGLCETGNVSDFLTKLNMLKDSNVYKVFLEKQEARLNQFQADKMAAAIKQIYVDLD